MDAERQGAGAVPAGPDFDDTQAATGSVIARLLKSPGSLAAQIAVGRGLWTCGLRLLLWGLFCHALYGVAMALFGGVGAAAMTLVKAPCIALSSILLCMPSLYVFSAVGGEPLTLAQAFAVGAAIVAMIGLLLLGLAPVAWLFAVSTNSSAFTVLFSLLAWIVAVGFACRFVNQFRAVPAFKRTAGLKWWLLVYVLVSLQMVTTQRPLLERPEQGWYRAEKQFFLAHFFESFGED